MMLRHFVARTSSRVESRWRIGERNHFFRALGWGGVGWGVLYTSFCQDLVHRTEMQWTRFAYSAPAFLLQRKAPMTCH